MTIQPSPVTPGTIQLRIVLLAAEAVHAAKAQDLAAEALRRVAA